MSYESKTGSESSLITHNSLLITEVCVVFALAREALFFRRSASLRVLETGMGAPAAERALREVLLAPTSAPRLVLSAGFSGALRPGLLVGDLVLATEVIDEEGNAFACSFVPSLPEHVRRGRILTSSCLVGDPGQKAALGARHQALAVDMESAALARLCRQHQVPFGCLRVISDAVDTALSPELVGLLGRGRVRPVALALALARRPSLLAELLRLAAHTRKAARTLAQGLHQILEQLGGRA
jgi:adenosylhomocysteine nucleosidase